MDPADWLSSIYSSNDAKPEESHQTIKSEQPVEVGSNPRKSSIFGAPSESRPAPSAAGTPQEPKSRALLPSFGKFGLSQSTLKSLKSMGFSHPTPIQRESWKVGLSGADVLGNARTGSGKTLAFLVVLVEKLAKHAALTGIRALIIAPTRELALQITAVLARVGAHSDLRAALLVGGDSLAADFAALAGNPDIVIGTPARVTHVLAEASVSLSRLEVLVLDEADRLLDMGFAPQLTELWNMIPSGAKVQTLLYSATLPSTLASWAVARLRKPELVRLDSEQRLSDQLSMGFFTVRPVDRLAALLYLIDRFVIAPGTASAIVFTATRHRVDHVWSLVTAEFGDTCSAVHLHGGMDQDAREIAMRRFRAGKARLLIVTDVAARGVDIPELDVVINYDFPAVPKLYVHRVGRCARQGRPGMALSLVAPEDRPYLADLAAHVGFRLDNTPPPQRDDVDEEANPMQVPLIRPNETRYGNLPRGELDAWADTVLRWHHESHELGKLQKGADNAQSMYIKTRVSASRAGVQKSKRMNDSVVHFAALRAERRAAYSAPEDGKRRGAVGDNAVAAELKHKLSAYRPRMTIFEAQVNASSGGATSQAVAATEALQALRSRHAFAIDARLKREAEDGAERQQSIDAELAALNASSGMDIMQPSNNLTEDEARALVQRGGASSSSSSSAAAAEDPADEPKKKRQRPTKSKYFIDYNGRQTSLLGNRAEETGDAAKDVSRFDNDDDDDGESGDRYSARMSSGIGMVQSDALLDLGSDAASRGMRGANSSGYTPGAGLLSGFGDEQADDAPKAQRRQTRFWDKKKKRFVQAAVNPNLVSQAARRARKELEGSKLSEKPKGALYAQWTRQSKSRVPQVGEREGAHGQAPTVGSLVKQGKVMTGTWKARLAPDARMASERASKKRKGGPNADAGAPKAKGTRTGQVRSVAEVRKARETKRTQQRRIQQRQKNKGGSRSARKKQAGGKR